MVRRNSNPRQRVHVHLITKKDEEEHKAKRQQEMLEELKHNYAPMGVDLTFEFNDTIHDRRLRTDTGWKITMGRGLDIFQQGNDGDWLNPQNRIQKMRRIKSCTFTYLRDDDTLTDQEKQSRN